MISDKTLDLVFGPNSSGNTLKERAKTSSYQYVRSQVQIALYTEGAKGRVISATEVLRAYGWETLKKIAMDGAAPLAVASNEPAKSLKNQRENLGLQIKDLAKKINADPSVVIRAETAGELSPIRIVEQLGTILALDERQLGFRPQSRGDTELGIRLREMSHSPYEVDFGAKTVLAFTEAAWVISRQADMQAMLEDEEVKSQKPELPDYDRDYSAPSYLKGYKLAKKARKVLGLDLNEPIESVRSLLDRTLKVPFVQQSMNKRFAGATIACGKARGIVVNEAGMNNNVWVRRMTICHELGHYLWDSDENLDKIKVDCYQDIDDYNYSTKKNPAETRANAFAIAFLAPPFAVKQIVDATQGDPHKSVFQVMEKFGISGTAAKRHIANLCLIDTSMVSASSFPTPDDRWIAAENYTLDHFFCDDTRISRRGKFSWLVAELHSRALISSDTAANYLECSVGDVPKILKSILSAWE